VVERKQSKPPVTKEIFVIKFFLNIVGLDMAAMVE